jgi:UDP-N-acetylenolpyruvoylglucosamine reductase
VNYGEREGAKFLELIGLIQKKVEGMFGVRLEPEVNVL